MAFASHKLASVLSCHAWDSRCARLAICPNNSEVHIYATPDLGSGWVRTAVLAEHDQLVSGLDWCGERLVSCSHDRNAFVWTCRDEGRWQPEMVRSACLSCTASLWGLRAPVLIVLCSLLML